MARSKAKRRIDLKHMEAAIAVAETLSFSRAAKRLHISQPAVTKYISNLWLIDERLVFSSYVSSDVPINLSDRPDLLIYDKRVMFRGDNEASNPVTVFEFKKPHRDDFVNPSSKEDPVQQIIRYVNSIKDGDFLTPEGKKIMVAANTPFLWLCDLHPHAEGGTLARARERLQTHAR